MAKLSQADILEIEISYESIKSNLIKLTTPKCEEIICGMTNFSGYNYKKDELLSHTKHDLVMAANGLLVYVNTMGLWEDFFIAMAKAGLKQECKKLLPHLSWFFDSIMVNNCLQKENKTEQVVSSQLIELQNRIYELEEKNNQLIGELEDEKKKSVHFEGLYNNLLNEITTCYTNITNIIKVQSELEKEQKEITQRLENEIKVRGMYEAMCKEFTQKIKELNEELEKEKNKYVQAEGYLSKENKVPFPQAEIHTTSKDYNKILIDHKEEIISSVIVLFDQIKYKMPNLLKSNLFHSFNITFRTDPSGTVDKLLDFVVKTNDWPEFLNALKSSGLDKKLHYLFN